MTPEERAALEDYSNHLDRRMIEMIERYHARTAGKGAPGGDALERFLKIARARLDATD